MADKKINIRNYTSEVPADRSILLIEKCLIEMGATNIAKEYIEGKVEAISFAIPHANQGVIPFRLPCKRDPIKKLFLSKHVSPTDAQKKRCLEQAERTAWKNIYDWVQIQATMILLEQVEMVEVFLPYMYDYNTSKTLFEKAKDKGFKMLN